MTTGPFLNLPRFPRAAVIRQRVAAGLAQFSFSRLLNAGMGVTSGGAPVLVAQNGVENLTATGAISIHTISTRLNITGGANVAFTLAAPEVDGQVKNILLETKGGAGNAVVTVTGLAAGTTLTFDTAGEGVTLVSANGKWFVVGNNGAAIA